MPSLNGSISFTVKFDLTGTPSLKLQATSTIPLIDQPNLTGYFYIKQPDELERNGEYTLADVVWTGVGYGLFSIPLRLGSDGEYQKGSYVISFFADCDGYTPGVFTRNLNVQYIPVTQILTNNFDCFTPLLTYTDATNYAVSNYNIVVQTKSWTAVATPGTVTGSLATIDLAIGGSYYDSSYAITYIKTITYQHATDTWLTIGDSFTNNITKAAFIPASMAVLLTYLIALKEARDAAANCVGDYDKLDKLFESANALYQLMRARVCAQNTTGLTETFKEFYRLTHNYQPQVYVNTNTVIPAYDFTTGCGGSGGGGTTVVIECVIGNAPVVTGTAFPVTGLQGVNDTIIICAAFVGMRVRVTRGSLIIPSINPGDGSNFFTKILAANSLELSAALVPGEYIKIETIP